MCLDLNVVADARRVFLELLFLHFNSIREGMAAGEHTKQGRASALMQSTVSSAITAQYEMLGSAWLGFNKS